MRRHWLMKSEPAEFGIDDVLKQPDRCIEWFGVRNYQARNFMQREMAVGDGVLFYHSSCKTPGIAGLAEVARVAQPDPTQFDATSKYFDSRATSAQPRWYCVSVRALDKLPLLDLATLRNQAGLAQLKILARANRLSITPVSPPEWRIILGLWEAAGVTLPDSASAFR